MYRKNILYNKKNAVIVCVYFFLIEFQRRETIIGRRVRRSYRDAKILETSVRIERREDGKRERGGEEKMKKSKSCEIV